MGTGGMGTGGMGTGGMGTGGMGTGGMGTGGMGTGGMGTGGMGTGGMGTGGMGTGASCTPEGPFDGLPVDAPANAWTWVPVPEAKCRGGGSAGFGVRINPASTKLVIYLQQGGACFNVATCGQNASSFSSAKFDSWKTSVGQSGLFDPTNAENAVKDWSFVFVPYCTGDVHAGNATGIDVPGGPTAQSFVGYANIGHYLKRVVPTFQSATEVLLTGDSAGGFGAHYNYDRVAQAFCPTPVALVDDSGPIMPDQYLAPCLQKRWRALWNLDSSLPAFCNDCSNADGGGLVNAYNAVGQKYPKAHLGVISSDKDSVISMFYGFGKNNCAGIDGSQPAHRRRVRRRPR